ncbi:MAG: pyridoxal-phosphate dependent enzyme [Deltaproteobacteria bacterium]|nr:pyridoxal-phosphate dependent enzyme [Deltaproteobacteria bacterium]
MLFTRGSATEFHHQLTNIEQYNSWLNPLAHAVTTGPELFETFDQPVDFVITPVGSCGAICGLHHYLNAADLQVVLVGVQPAVGHGIPGTNVVVGDVAWSPENYSPAVLSADHIFTVDEIDAYAFTAKLWACGIPAGPSTGMALAQAHELVRGGATGNLVVISPDSNFKYGDLIRDSLREMKDDIIARHPELEIDDSIDAYVEEMKESSGLGHTLQRIRQCYPIDVRGQLYREHDIHDIVWAAQRVPRARRRDVERNGIGLR